MKISKETFVEHFLPSLLSMAVALSIFSLGACHSSIEKEEESKIAHIIGFQALVSEMAFDVVVKAQYACSSARVREREIKKLIQDTKDLNLKFKSIYDDLIRDEVSSKGVTPEMIKDKMKYYDSELNEIKGTLFSRSEIFEYVSDGYKDIVVKGELASLSIKDDKFDDVFRDVVDISYEVARYDSGQVEHDCKDSEIGRTSEQYSELSSRLENNVSDLENLKNELNGWF